MTKLAPAVSALMSKVLSGEPVTAQDWRDYFCAYHQSAPGGTFEFFDQFHDAAGHTSYEILADALPPQSARVLDIACGEGAAVPFYRNVRPGCAITGIDICEPAIDVAREKFGDSRTTFLCAPATALPLADDAFDVVTSHLSLLLIEPVEIALQEIRRVLRPGGTAVFVIENPIGQQSEYQSLIREGARFLKSLYPDFTPVQTNSHVRSAAQLETLIEACGFKSVKSEDVVVEARMSRGSAIKGFAHLYIFGTLEPEVEKQFLDHMSDMARRFENSEGFMHVGFPLSRLTCR